MTGKEGYPAGLLQSIYFEPNVYFCCRTDEYSTTKRPQYLRTWRSTPVRPRIFYKHEPRLCHFTQRELKLNAKRLEKAEGFASALEAELQRVAGDGATFEAFVVLRRENHNLKTQLAEIKQVAAIAFTGRGFGTKIIDG